MRASILFAALALIPARAYAQDVDYRVYRLDHARLVEDNQRRASQVMMPAAKASQGGKYLPSLAISVITPGEPGAVFSGATFVTSPALRVGVQWPF